MAKEHTPANLAVRELVLFAILFFVGLTFLPLSIYLVGQAVFGQYGGGGFGGFHGTLRDGLAAGRPSAWFLVLSPYIVWQLLRLTALAFRLGGRDDAPGRGAARDL